MSTLPQKPSAVLIGPNSDLFGSKLRTTNFKETSLALVFLCVRPTRGDRVNERRATDHLSAMRAAETIANEYSDWQIRGECNLDALVGEFAVAREGRRCVWAVLP